MQTPTLPHYLDKKVLILGAGVTGLPTAQYLTKQGSIVSFADDHVTTVEGFNVAKPSSYNAIDWDFIVVSPGWRENHPFILDSLSKNIPILNEIDIAWEIKPSSQKWIALTGTNGKTTTVEMTAAMLCESGFNAIACGNVGQTVIECVQKPYDLLVLEISSFQLHWMKKAHFVASALLNIADDHVDWHGSFDLYAKAKVSLLEKSDLSIINADDQEALHRTSQVIGKKIFYSLGTPAPGELGVVEELIVDRAFVKSEQEAEMIAEVVDVKPTVPHNVSNALAASALALSVGAQRSDIRKALQSFSLGRHRIEKVFEDNGITWIDDSKATNPHAAAASLMSALSVIWIAGGLAKGARMAPLVERAHSRIKAAILMGKDRNKISEELRRVAPHIDIYEIDSPIDYVRGGHSNSLMEAIVTKALEIAQAGDTVLLAPACASMDQFISYADRGNRFKAAIEKVVPHAK